MYTRCEPRIEWQRGLRRVYQIAGVFTAMLAQVLFNGFLAHHERVRHIARDIDPHTLGL